jgi:hypothetical protein
VSDWRIRLTEDPTGQTIIILRVRPWGRRIGKERVDTLYVDPIERYAEAGRVGRKDVVNLAFHEFFGRRDDRPRNGKGEGMPDLAEEVPCR